MTMGFMFKSKKHALAFAAAVEERFKLPTNTFAHTHIDASVVGRVPEPETSGLPDAYRSVEVQRASLDDEGDAIERAVEAMAKTMDGQFIGT